MLTINHFDYTLPPELIAQTPVSPRDHSRLLVLDRQKQTWTHHHFYDLPNLLSPETVLVRNNTKVLPARIYGQKTTGGKCELLLIKQTQITQAGQTWECLTKPGLKPGQSLVFADSPLTATCTAIEGFTRLIEFNLKTEQFFAALEQIGHTPIPPYIHWHEEDETQLRELYQTTYAKHQGSVAAPTAGLHFTPELDQRLLAKGIQIEEVTLHVGLGTFLPLQPENLAAQQLHAEEYHLNEDTAERLNQAKIEGKKILAIGTTSTRVLESCAVPNPTTPGPRWLLQAGSADTRLMIAPPYQYKIVDHLITNFHLPQSSLLMLLSAFVCVPNTHQDFSTFIESSAGRAYQEAIQQRYRFYSFGDAMLVR